jgi:hypothetical protein
LTCVRQKWLDQDIHGGVMHVQSDPQRSPNKTPRQRRANDPNDRPWTAVEKYKLRGLVDRRLPNEKIARTLRRPIASVIAMAASLGLPLGG